MFVGTNMYALVSIALYCLVGLLSAPLLEGVVKDFSRKQKAAAWRKAGLLYVIWILSGLVVPILVAPLKVA